MKKTVLKNNVTEVVFILDRSGSMGGLESDTIGGYNSMLEKQKDTDGEINVTTVLFDDKVDLLYDNVPLKDVKKMTEKEYFVRGCTALLDAVGSTVDSVGKRHKKGIRPDKTLFVITTDGLENASCEYSYAKVKKMIEKKKEKYNWEFLFLGANIDAVAEAGRLGINADKAVKFKSDKKGTQIHYNALAKAVCCFADAKCGSIDEDWKKEIEEYCES